jgi:Zn-dependent protease/CBS domain-containing protein
MNGNIRVGTLFGIPFYVNPSWFLVLGLVTLRYGDWLEAKFSYLPEGVPLLLGLATALLLFSSVVAHELGHSFVALRQGISVNSITLFLFGGLASLEKESDTPGGAFWVAIAGPLVSFAIFGIAALMGSSLQLAGPAGAILGLITYINLSLGIFNLPGLPLDGGNILKAAVWKITGNPYKGVKFASRVGQVFGWVAIVSGVLPFLVTSNIGSINIWNVLIGWFLLQNAGQSAQYARVQEQFVGLTAADAVTPNGPIVTDRLTLREFADQRILSRENWRQFLVVDVEGKLLGAIAIDALETIPNTRWSTTLVGELAKPVEVSNTIDGDQPLLEVVRLLEESKLPSLTVVRNNGVLVGLLEKASIVNLLQRRAQAGAA